MAFFKKEKKKINEKWYPQSVTVGKPVITDGVTKRTAAESHRHIYLYHHKGRVWGCCGRFALLLHRIYPNIPYMDRDVSGKGDVLPVMIIDPFTLGDLIERLSPPYVLIP